MPEPNDGPRRYILVVQSPEGYPPGDAPLESSDGPIAPPMLHSVVMADAYDKLEADNAALRDALRPFVAAYDAIGRLHCPGFDGPEALGYFEAAATALGDNKP